MLRAREAVGALLVLDRAGACLAGVGANHYRPWLYPLYTPAGQIVLREFPGDHPFHNGCFVAQHPVRAGERTANFWAAPPPRGADDELFSAVGRIETKGPFRAEPHADGLRVTLECVWLDASGAPVLEETRTLDFGLGEDAVFCELASEKRAACGPLEFPATQFGGIGVRVDPRLLPAAGGCILSEHGRGEAQLAHGRLSSHLAFESAPGAGPRFGLCLIGEEAGVPWFVRDYGLALFNPTWRRALALERGASWRLRLRLVAYDGALDARRLERWLAGRRR
jgi:hypothetical protein